MAYDEFTAKMVRKCSELEQALAEKDMEIEAKETELGKLDAELIISRASYRQLMERAVRFARAMAEEWGDDPTSDHNVFLCSPEVRAWRKEQT